MAIGDVMPCEVALALACVDVMVRAKFSVLDALTRRKLTLGITAHPSNCDAGAGSFAVWSADHDPYGSTRIKAAVSVTA